MSLKLEPWPTDHFQSRLRVDQPLEDRARAKMLNYTDAQVTSSTLQTSLTISAASTKITKMMKTFITRRGEGQGKTKKERKATKSKGRGLEEGASRALMRKHGEEGCGERG